MEMISALSMTVIIFYLILSYKLKKQTKKNSNNVFSECLHINHCARDLMCIVFSSPQIS